MRWRKRPGHWFGFGTNGNDRTSDSPDYIGSRSIQIVEQYGYSGNDILWGLTVCENVIYGDNGDDYIYSNLGSLKADGGPDNDTVLGSAFFDRIWGGSGNDSLLGRGGDDLIWGDAGNDFLDGGDGDDDLSSGSGRDTLVGGNGADVIVGAADVSSYLLAFGGNGNDMFEIRGIGKIYGESGDDFFKFKAAESEIGRSSATSAYGGLDADTFIIERITYTLVCHGNEGDDNFTVNQQDLGRIIILEGGPGSDIFNIHTASPVYIAYTTGESFTLDYDVIKADRDANIKILFNKSSSGDFHNLSFIRTSFGNGYDNVSFNYDTDGVFHTISFKMTHGVGFETVVSPF